MKIPNKIRIGEKEYAVKESRFLLEPSLGGRIDYLGCELSLKKGIVNSRDKESVFFHEIAHGILRELEFNYPKATAFRDNETFVQELGLLLRITFQDLLNKQGGPNE